MTLAAYQQCRSLAGWVPVVVPSQSDPRKTYTVLVNPWGALEENICECEGYEFRGYCAHQGHAKSLLCGWDELVPRGRSQSVHQRHQMICPKCEGSTMWAFKPLDTDDEVSE